MQNKNLKDFSTDEIFTEIKNRIDKTDKTQLKDYANNLEVALKSAIDTKQKLLIEQCLFFKKCLKKEERLVEIGINKFIYKDDIEDLVETLNTSNDKNIYLIDLDRFPRVIPKDVAKKIKKIQKEKLFDNYYVMYTDYTNKTKNLKKAESGETRPSKDPIVFGAFLAHSKDTKINYMGERLYYIADWIDEFCDLTMDRVLREAPEVVFDIYANGVVDEETRKNIEKLEQEMDKKWSREEVIESFQEKPKKSFLKKLKELFHD